MIRKQVYLTERQSDELAQIAKTKGIKQAEVLRDVIDRGLNKFDKLRAFEGYICRHTPSWIQFDETPSCCGKPMSFVGQVEDPTILDRVPDGAKMWFHDWTCFYIFTCTKCLETKIVAQQY